MNAVVLQAQGLRKRFGATVALDGAGLLLRAGEIHALMGQNGAGKSTMIKLLTGVEAPDSGRIELDGHAIAPATPLHAQQHGISTVYQEVNLCPNLSVAENLSAGRYPRRWSGFIDHAKMRADARALVASLNLQLDVDRALGSYPVAVQQMVAIARALGVSARVLILDEPTSSLDQQEVGELFKVLRQLRDRGMAILFVTHFLDQVYAICDRITVLRNGAPAGEYLTAELSQAALVTAMVGREMAAAAAADRGHAAANAAPCAIEATGLGRRGAIEPLDLSVRAGEVLGLGGLLGSGRTELALTLFGAYKRDSGEIRMKGKPVALNGIR
ncbi:MAG: sugar ABC transporter ATP-binding protein, partial [Steroidobacteraceae bacterium]